MSQVLHTRVYKRTRRSHGKLVTTYRGYYTLEKNGPRFWKALGTPDKGIAEKRIMAFGLQAQREQEGLLAPRAIRETAAKLLPVLIEEYEEELESRGVVQKHRHDTITRIRRIVRETGWRSVAEINADSFLVWRRTLKCSAKTNKEYQISLNAFLNWLVESERMTKNPIARIDAVPTKGKQVRQYRAFTEVELARLFAVAGKRRLAYQVLLYSGQRKSEVRALVWGDLHLDAGKPYALFRVETMKDDEKRAVPLRHEIAEELRAIRPPGVDPTKKVFWFCWPTYDILRGDLKRAGIERKDGLGRVLHFHSFRKTMQSLGVRCGINQRAAQEILGHSDANLTAQAYTDVASLQLHDEIAKLPWISNDGVVAQHGAQKSGVSGPVVSFPDLVRQLKELLQATGTEGTSHETAPAGILCQFSGMAARAGIEPATK
jgi:integrase